MKKLILLLPVLVLSCATPAVVIPMLNFGTVKFESPGLRAFNNEGNASSTIRDPTEIPVIKTTEQRESVKQKEPMESDASSRLEELQAKQRAALERLKR